METSLLVYVPAVGLAAVVGFFLADEYERELHGWYRRALDLVWLGRAVFLASWFFLLRKEGTWGLVLAVVVAAAIGVYCYFEEPI